MEKESKIAKGLKKKEIVRARQSKRTVVPIKGDLLQQEVEVIVNSVGEDLKYGFGGAIGKAIVKACGEGVIKEAISEAEAVYGSAQVKVGDFVSTSAGNSDKHKYILHCVCPEWESKDCETVLKDLIKKVFHFCDKVKVESIAVPPMSSGVLRFPVRNCVKAFFNGVMEFLEEVKSVTSIKNMRIVIFDEGNKAKEFQDEWDFLFKTKYGDDIDSEKEVSGEEDSASDDDYKPKSSVKPKPTGKGVAASNTKKRVLDSDDSDEEVKQKKDTKKAVYNPPKRQIIDSDSDSDDTIATGKGKQAVAQSKVSVKKTGAPKVSSKKKPADSDSSSDSDVPSKNQKTVKPSAKPAAK